MKPRFSWAALLLLPAAVCAPQDAAVVRETQPRKPVHGDPVLNPASANRHPGLPARALAQGARAEREPENAHWAEARDSEDTRAFAVRTGVRSMNEPFPLARAAEAYERMNERQGAVPGRSDGGLITQGSDSSAS